MDGVLVVCGSHGFAEVDLEGVRLLRNKHVPCHLVRTKIDADLARSAGAEGPTLAAIKGALQAQAQGHRVFLVSGKDRMLGDPETLLRCIEKDLRHIGSIEDGHSVYRTLALHETACETFSECALCACVCVCVCV